MPFGFRSGTRLAVMAVLCTPPLFAYAQQDEADALTPATPQRREGLFVREPEKPIDLFDAVVIAIDLGRPELARDYLQKLLDSGADDATLFQLRRQRGAAEFLRLTKIRQLELLADTLMQRVNEAARSFARDPERIAELIELLGASRTEQAWAISELRSAGTAAVAPLVHVLADPDQSPAHPGVLAALRHLDRDATPAMIATLESESVWLKTPIIQLFAQRGDRAAAPYLWSIAAAQETPPQLKDAAGRALYQLTGRHPANVSATAMLLAEARRYDRQRVPMTPDVDGMVEIWRWDAQAGDLAAERFSPEQAARILAGRFARAALELAPEDPEAQTVFLTTALARDAAVVGAAGALPEGPGTALDLALSAGPELPVEVLRRALADRRHALARAATQIVGQVADESLLFPKGGQSVLLDALRYPERRVQFAAAEAILGLRPSRHFDGSAEVISVLARAVRSRGEEKALVADVQLERGRRLAGLADQLGYETDVALSGKDAFRKAAASSDYEFILLDLNILRWELSETLANLKSDTRTAGIPVYLVGPLEWSSVAKRYAQRYQQVKYVVRPAAAKDLLTQLANSADAQQSPPLSAEERMTYAQRALAWLYGIASGQVPVGDVQQAAGAIQDALQQPELAADAALVLGLLPSRAAQQSLVQVTLDDRRPVELRRSAADQLCYNIRKHGRLLEAGAIVRLAQLYQTTSDAGLHRAVAAVMGCLGYEPRHAGRRLQDYRAATAAPANAAQPDVGEQANPGQQQ